MKNFNLKCLSILRPLVFVSLLTILLSLGCSTIPEESFSEEQVSMEFSSLLWSKEPRQGIDTENEENYELYYREGENYKPLDFGKGSLQRSQEYSGSVDMALYSKVIKKGVVSYKYLNMVTLDSACEKALIFIFRAYGGVNYLLIDVSNLSSNDNYALFVNLVEANIEVRYDGVKEKIKYGGSHSKALTNLSGDSLKPINLWVHRGDGPYYFGDKDTERWNYHRQDIDFTPGEPSLLVHYDFYTFIEGQSYTIDVINDVKLLRNK